MRYNTLGACMTSVIAGLMSYVPASAQAVDDSASSGTGDIVVTARRTEERLEDVPISVTVYNQQAISDRNIVSTTDLGTYTPSLSVNARYGPERASFAIRGFVQDFQTAPSVGVYFADVVAPRAGAGITAGNGAGVGSLFDLQNVQVLKGPQGTLFGRNTTGGAVLLVPQKPTDKLEGYVEGSAGDYGMWRLQGVLNVPLSDTFKVRLGVDRMKNDGYLKNHSGIGPDRLGNTDYVAARLSVVANLTPDLENYLIASYSNSDTYGIVQRVVGCNRDTPPSPSIQALGYIYACGQVDRQNARGDGWWDVENSVPDPQERTETWQVINTTTWRASDTLTIKNIASYAQLTGWSSMSLGGDDWQNPDGSPFANVVTTEDMPGYPNGAQSTATEELQLQGSTTDGRLKWQAGGYREISDPLRYATTSSPFLLNCVDPEAYQCNQGLTLDYGSLQVPISTLSQSFMKTWWRSAGIYAQGTYNLTDKLALTAGARYTWDSMRQYVAATGVRFPAADTPVAFCSNPIRVPGPGGPGTTKSITPGDFQQCGVEFSTRSSKPTWVIDLEYKPVSDLMLYGKWSRGYRAGGVNASYPFFESWQPEKVDTYEIGAKASFDGAIRGYFNITGFYNDFRNQQIQAILQGKVGSPQPNGTATINAGKSRIWGIEVDSAVTLLERFKLEVGYTYLNTKLISLTGIPPEDDTPYVPGQSPWKAVVPTATPGSPLTLAPKNRVTLTGTYTLPLPEELGDFSVSATYVHTDKQIANTATLPQFGILPPTDLLNLNANWGGVLGKPVDLSFFMTNVTNAKFPLNASNYWPTFGFESQVVNEPRMWGVRVRYRFGV